MDQFYTAPTYKVVSPIDIPERVWANNIPLDSVMDVSIILSPLEPFPCFGQDTW